MGSGKWIEALYDGALQGTGEFVHPEGCDRYAKLDF